MFSNVSGRYTEEGLLSHMVILFLFFWGEPPYSFLQWLCEFTFPPAVNEGSFFSSTSPTLVSTCLVDSSHFNRCEVKSYCSFDLHFPNS